MEIKHGDWVRDTKFNEEFEFDEVRDRMIIDRLIKVPHSTSEPTPPDVPSEKKCCDKCDANDEMGMSICGDQSCSCHTHSPQVGKWEQKIWMWATNAIPIENRANKKVEELIALISTIESAARKEEESHWINQPANDHDNKIRQAEREKILATFEHRHTKEPSRHFTISEAYDIIQSL